MLPTSSTTGPAPCSNHKPNTAAPTTKMNTDYTKSVNVKMAPFDGAKASFYLWTTYILGFDL
jgi:hypothetical protein